ncbi:hypothetical protein RJ639_010821 [Escallonia herrerae]|uniref:BHLH domain-containing protein n=1 Tax=Escallonia herrerae TaxID=1293975 RepID=A0AA88VN79_9ASTE|nr:hypothetical protein RJ639_010821 [Escallonia herrerae]
MEHNPSSSSRVDRKTIEKNRRNEMKALYSQLKSLVPSSSRVLSLTLTLSQNTHTHRENGAAKYIKKLQIKLERMKEKKESLMGVEKPDARLSRETMVGLRPPQIDVREVGSALEVVLVTGLDCKFLFNKTIRLLHEEGAEVVNANYSVLDDAAFHTIHSKVGQSATGYEAARISGRLKKFVYGAASFEV